MTWDFIAEQGWIKSLTKGEWQFIPDDEMCIAWPDVWKVQTMAIHPETWACVTVRKRTWQHAREEYAEVMKWRASCARAIQQPRAEVLDTWIDEAV